MDGQCIHVSPQGSHRLSWTNLANDARLSNRVLVLNAELIQCLPARVGLSYHCSKDCSDMS